MRDTKLFQYIQDLIRQSHNSRPTEPLNFAEKYCKQQMIKKKLNVNRGQKMTHLMRNFKGLETFVDLPQLIEAVKRWSFASLRQEKEKNNVELNLQTKIHQQQPANNHQYKSLKSETNLGEKIKKQLGQKMKQKYLIQNSLADQLLSSLQQTTTINSAALKNNSPNNINVLYQKVQKDGNDQTWKGGMEFLSKLNEIQSIYKNNEDSNTFGGWLQINKYQQDPQKQEVEMNMKFRKQYTNLLHKITTYVQIVLEMQHRKKWQSKNQLENHQTQNRKLNRTVIIHRNGSSFNPLNKENSPLRRQLRSSLFTNSTPIKHSLTKNKQKIRLRTVANNGSMLLSRFKSQIQGSHDVQNKQITNKLEFLPGRNENLPKTLLKRDKTSRLKKHPIFFHRKQASENPIQTQSNPTFHKENSEIDIRCTASSSRTPILNSHRQKENQNANQHHRYDSFLRTTSSANLREEATRKRREDLKSEAKKNHKESLLVPNTPMKLQSILKETFTFRNRDVKQKIVNRLGSFIRQIDEEEINNRKQNHHFMKAINKLENTLSLCFGQFRQEAVAGERDIETVKKYAHVFRSGNISGLSSKFINFNENGNQGNTNFQEE